MDRYLLVVDLQTDKEDENGQYDKCIEYIDEHGNEYDAIISTFICDNIDGKVNLNFSNHLKNTVAYEDELVDFSSDAVIARTAYGIQFDNFFTPDECEITIIGHGLTDSILGMCFHLWDGGFNFVCLKDYIYSNDSNVNKEAALQILTNCFGDCIQ